MPPEEVDKNRSVIMLIPYSHSFGLIVSSDQQVFIDGFFVPLLE